MTRENLKDALLVSEDNARVIVIRKDAAVEVGIGGRDALKAPTMSDVCLRGRREPTEQGASVNDTF